MITLQFIPYAEIEQLGTAKRIKKLLDLVKDNKIVLLEGRLKKEEEAELIKRTMEEINDHFKGIELSVIYPSDKDSAAFFQFFQKFRKRFISLLLGDRQGFTIIGPANIVKEIKRDPEQIQLLTDDEYLRRKLGGSRK
ncbi:DUF2073 domain-containing protein [Candidatus Woesearchaeota archaeon]|nr:DUF2073 domain-containing protein [Candidatus Woesearchaeota archaeon]